MNGRIGEIGAAVRLHHTDIIGGDVAVDARGVHAFDELGVVYLKAGDLLQFHRVLRFVLKGPFAGRHVSSGCRTE